MACSRSSGSSSCAGQLHEHGRHLVGPLQLGHVGRHRDRDDRHERDVGQLVAGQEVGAQRPGAHGQHHVVDGGAHLVLELLGVGQAGGGEGDPASGVHGDVDGGARRRQRQGRLSARPLRGRGGCRRGCASCAASCGRCRTAPRGWPPSPGTPARSSTGCASRAGARDRRGVSGGFGSRSKSTPSSSAPETPSIVLWCILVTSAILPSSSPSTIHISHSGRSRCSWRLMTSAAKSPSSRMPPGGGQRRPPEVVVDVELGVVDPDGVAEAHRHLDQPALEDGGQRDPVADELADAPERVAAGHRGGVEHGRHRHVHVERGRLHVEEAGIEPAQSFGCHRRSLVTAPRP